MDEGKQIIQLNIHQSITNFRYLGLPQTLPIPCIASFDHSSFNEASTGLSNRSACSLNGQMICTNQIKEFNDKIVDKKNYIDEFGKGILQSILNDEALENPEKHLSKVGLLVYADLKKYKFAYFFCFPALNFPKNVFMKNHTVSGDGPTMTPILNIFSENGLLMLQNEYDKSDSQRSFSRGYFIVKHYINTLTNQDEVQAYPLTEYDKIAYEKHQNQSDVNIYFAFTDPSSSKSYPGWPLRNFLCLIVIKFKLEKIKIIRIRKSPTNQLMSLQDSMFLEVSYDREELPSLPQTIGWELDGKLGKPRQTDLSNLLDPKKLAEDAVNLNLRLMKWRLMPTLDLDRIASTKCLLLGCGTLGCHIARGLLAWGIKNLSLIDNAKISYSNPVRQSLYTFEDCIAQSPSGAFKATVAEASLRKIHPTANIRSYILSVPMPGHHVTEKELEQTEQDVKLLERLIDEHDVIFLLMDTRESRWLPTVMAMSKQKLVINAAIGFDTFLLQRYGMRDYSSPNTEQDQQQQVLSDSGSFNSAPSTSQDSYKCNSSEGASSDFLDSDKLGCYFCNDIVAPGDSTLDRTLDQQCTVSRPGVSMMVSALAVELLASVMSSRKLAHTPAPTKISDYQSSYSEEYDSELGIVPHSIRGNLATYHIYKPTSAFFEKCSACSKAVINAYRADGFEFLKKVFDDPTHLEEISGLKDLQNVSDNVWALTDDDEYENDVS